MIFLSNENENKETKIKYYIYVFKIIKYLLYF